MRFFYVSLIILSLVSMDITKAIVNEFEIRVFNESFARIKLCIDLIDENDIWQSPNDKITSIGSSILHICGNAKQWMCSAIGGDDDLRERNEEFNTDNFYTKIELIELIENTENSLHTVLSQLTTQDLKVKYVIQGFSVSGFSSIVHVIEHVSYHTGQITLLAKLFTNKSTNYYDEKNLTQRNSN